MSASLKTNALRDRLHRAGIDATFDQAETLRRATLTLQRWYELECGDGNNYASWAIERDEETGIAYRCVYPHDGKVRRYRIADKEAGAKRRVERIAKELGAHVYYQTDPRGCVLYVGREPFKEFDHSGGVPCEV